MTWKNEDDSPHWIGDITGQFKSAALYADKTFLHIGVSLGEYSYVYTIRP